MLDVVVVGAGPAGCVAAIVLARAGLRVRLLDRARFPRDKLCGDTVNPGALAVLHGLGLSAADAGLPVTGMIVTGPHGARADAAYPCGAAGRALRRRELDLALLQHAADAGAEIEEDALVLGAAIDAGRDHVCGALVRTGGGGSRRIAARLVIGADGRASRIARSVGLARHPVRPRRWAVGAYFSGVAGLTARGEMHVRVGHYVGVAPLPGGLANACVVTDDTGRLRAAGPLLRAVLAADAELGPRFARARMIDAPQVLGPLAVDCAVPGMPGLLLAGDAAGFIDPMTGDGLRFALRGAQLAAAAALGALESGERHVYRRLAAARRREFAVKWRFNRALRQLVASPRAVRAGARLTRLSGWPVARAIGYAADLPDARHPPRVRPLFAGRQGARG